MCSASIPENRHFLTKKITGIPVEDFLAYSFLKRVVFSFRMIGVTWALLGALLAQTAYGQGSSTAYTDSLRAIVNKPNPDSASVTALMQLQRYFFERGQYDSTLNYAQQARRLTAQLKDEKASARAHYNMGMTYTNLARYDSARFYLDAVLGYWPVVQDTVLQVSAYNALGILSNYQSDYESAVEYLLEAEALIDQSSSAEVRNLFPQILSGISRNLIAEKQYVRGIEYAKKALRIRNYPTEGRYRVILHLEITDAYLKLKNTTLAKAHLDSAVFFNQSLNNMVISNFVFMNEGNYHQAMQDHTKAFIAYQEAYRLCKQIRNDYLIATAAGSLANACYLTGRYDEAIQYANEVIALGKPLKQYDDVAGSYDVLKRVATSRGEFKNALQYAELHKIYVDSNTNAETQKRILGLESRYQHQKREQELATLKSESTLRELETVRSNRMYLIAGISAVALIIILIIYSGYSRQKQTLAEKERKLQEDRVKFLERQQQVVSLQSMINGQETERTRIAKDLHDGLGGVFSTIKMYFNSLHHEQPALREQELFQKSYTLVNDASEEIRRIAHNMMPEVLMKMGLVNALKDLCANISAGKLLQVKLEVHGMDKRLNTTTEIMLFRIMQELLNNIIKHAQATEAIIQFVRDGNRLSVQVEDNGRGFNTSEADKNKNMGMENIQSRVAYLNGKLSIDSQHNVGTTVMMDFLIQDV